jgi:hypothetical protein
MSEELEPLGELEFVLRRVHKNHFDPRLANPIQRVAFRPNEGDDTGLSVYRARFVKAYVDVLLKVKAEKRGHYYICRLQVCDLTKLGLTVVPDPDPEDIPGHCIIPELSWPNYQADHDRLADIGDELALLGNQAIVYKPPA